MQLNPVAQTVMLLLALQPVIGIAACKGERALSHYDGVIGDKYRVRMTLELGSYEVKGVYFYATQLKDVQVIGKIIGESDLQLDELNASGKAVVRFEGTFPVQDPERKLGAGLQCELIVGTWHKLDSTTTLPFRLQLESTTGGDLEHRYIAANAFDDNLVNRNARRFWDAVKREDKEAIASLINYPITVSIAGAARKIRSRQELLDNYDAIFSVGYRKAIAEALPLDMFARDQGIMLGDGEVWFGPDGRVKALNNF